MGRRARVLVLTGLVLATSCALGVTGAAATTTVKKTVTVHNDGEIASVKSKCPHGQRATGGGFSETEQMVTMSNFAFLKTFRSSKQGQRSWRVKAQENSFEPVAMKVTAFAYCSKDAPRTHAERRSVKVPQGVNGFTASSAHCDGGETVQGGGFSLSTPNFDGNLLDSHRVGSSAWRTRIDADIGVTNTSIAYCADRHLPGVERNSIASSGDEQVAGISSRCQKGYELLGGGFEQPDAISGFAGNDYSQFGVTSSRGAGRSWLVGAEHGGPTQSHLVALAYCG